MDMGQLCKNGYIEDSTCCMTIEHFSLEQIYESGQAFRWIKLEPNDYIVINEKKWVRVKQKDELVTFYHTSKEDMSMWIRYFDLDRDYGEIKNSYVGIDDYLDKAMEYGYGVRILKQNLFEILITFIISSNNHIPRIKNSVLKISEFAKNRIGEYGGIDIFSFPSPSEMVSFSEDQWKELRLGYREKYIRRTVEMIEESDVDLQLLYDMDTKRAKEELMKFSGVGDKVADCILLYGLGRFDTFPVDTWMKKVMQTRYQMEEVEDNKKIRKKGLELFGDTAGIAQQYLFYYERTKRKGR